MLQIFLREQQAIGTSITFTDRKKCHAKKYGATENPNNGWIIQLRSILQNVIAYHFWHGCAAFSMLGCRWFLSNVPGGILPKTVNVTRTKTKHGFILYEWQFRYEQLVRVVCHAFINFPSIQLKLQFDSNFFKILGFSRSHLLPRSTDDTSLFSTTQS